LICLSDGDGDGDDPSLSLLKMSEKLYSYQLISQDGNLKKAADLLDRLSKRAKVGLCFAVVILSVLFFRGGKLADRVSVSSYPSRTYRIVD
jgi:hypothetical protein